MLVQYQRNDSCLPLLVKTWFRFVMNCGSSSSNTSSVLPRLFKDNRMLFQARWALQFRVYLLCIFKVHLISNYMNFS